MVRTQIQLTDQQSAELKALARERDMSVAELIRQGVDALLSQRDTPSWEQRKRRALAAVGAFGGDADDVSTDHDRYLGEAEYDWHEKRASSRRA